MSSRRSSTRTTDFEGLAEFRYQLRKYLRFSEEMTHREGVTPLQYLLLLQIRGYPGRQWATVAELAERLQASGYQATALTLTLTVGEQQEMTTGAPLKPPTAAVEVLARISARLLGKLTPETGVTGLSLTAYPLREWRLGAQQLSLVDETTAPRLIRLHETLRLLWIRFGETVIRLASAIGPPLPLPIQVSLSLIHISEPTRPY